MIDALIKEGTDEEFVTAAYRQILGRDPDISGLQHYLVQLFRGEDRRNVLADLAMSAEGRGSIDRIAGLKAVVFKRRLSRLPLFSAFARARRVDAFTANASSAIMRLAAIDAAARMAPPVSAPLPVPAPLPEDYALIRQTVKYFGYQLAIKLAGELPIRKGLTPTSFGLPWKASTQEDLESDWVAYWLSELKLPVIFHRKLWEYAFVLQAIYERGVMRPGARGLGFGCGEEPIASYLAMKGIDILVTDLETEAAKSVGWLDSHEHSSSLDSVYKPNLVDRQTFDRHVSHRFVDMNAIPSDLVDFDFCWSICSMEHLGSIRNGLDFVINTMKTLRSGGVSVHTTEFNFMNDETTLDNNPMCVLFQKRHFLQLAEELKSRGYEVSPIDFYVGGKPLDSFIDIPPYGSQWPEGQKSGQSIATAHIKSAVAGYASTCFGIIAKAP